MHTKHRPACFNMLFWVVSGIKWAKASFPLSWGINGQHIQSSFVTCPNSHSQRAVGVLLWTLVYLIPKTIFFSVILHWHSALTFKEWHFIFILKLCCQIGIDKFKYIQYEEIGKKRRRLQRSDSKDQNGELLPSVLASFPHLFLLEMKSVFIFLGGTCKEWMKRTKSIVVLPVLSVCIYRKKM